METAPRSFYGTLQGWFKNEFGGDYAGRYISLLFEHTARADADPFRLFFSSSVGSAIDTDFTLQREFVFPGVFGGRRADLAVIVDSQPRLLVELKYRDRLSLPVLEKPAQLADYLHYCRHNRDCKFLLIHREPQRTSDVAAIQSAGHKLAHYSELAAYLKNSKNQAAALLLEYFQEEGLVLENIDTDHLYRFLHRFVMPWRQGGRINVTSKITERPRQFLALLNNMRLIAADVTPQLMRATGKESARSATIDVWVHNWLDKKEVSNLMRQPTRDGKIYISPQQRRGGRICVYAQNAFSEGKKWLYVAYGFEIDVLPKRKLQIDAYAELLSPEIQRAWKAEGDDRFYYAGSIALRWFNKVDQARFDVDFIEMIRMAAKSTLRSGVVTERSNLRVLNGLAGL